MDGLEPLVRSHTLAAWLAASVLLLLTAPVVRAAPGDPVLHLACDGDVRDSSGHGNDGFVPRPQFEPGQRGQGLRLGGQTATIADSADLRLAPGIVIDVWVQFTTVTPGIIPLVVKEREYMLRVDPLSEGGQFSFFAYFEDWEPRIKSPVVARPGQWYHLVAGWDGASITLTVDGSTVQAPRTGRPRASDASLAIGPLDGLVDELRVINPAARQAGVAHWSFDGDLRDDTGQGHDLTAAAAPRFGPGRTGQALLSGPAVETPSRPDLQLAAGLRIDCTVIFEESPSGITYLAIKDGEYQLRVDPPEEGGRFSFFVNLGGWEPRVQSASKAQVGVWYRVIARWDGLSLTLDVNGERTQLVRSGQPRPGDEPLRLGPVGGRIDDLRIENPRLPVLRVKSLDPATTLLTVGQPTKLTALIENVGTAVEGAVARLEPGSGVTCLGPVDQPLGDLAGGASRAIEWTVEAAAAVSTTATVRLTAADYQAPEYRRTLAFFATTDAPVVPVPTFGVGPAKTWYIDSVAGDNAQAGTSPETAWRDFTPINGRTLGPGERLLIKRGSVINQELVLSATGTAERWAEIGTYGEGARPILRRNWDIAERCALITDPDFLVIRGLVVGYAGKGLVVYYRGTGHQGLVIEDCVAHHIEGLYRRNANGIPEWRDRDGAPGDSLRSSAGIAVVGAPATDVLLRDCEMFQCSWGFFVSGNAVTVDRVFCHDNFVHNTSPHPAMVAVRRSFLQNSVFDAPGWHASAGTMGIMLVDTQGLVIRNCTFRNQPDSGSHDEGGIDFEARGDGCLIDGCTFERNAGAAIEVLGLKSPQIRNLEITSSRFIQNNLARKLGPSEIFIWGRSPNPEVCCSTGLVHGNGYLTEPGVEFFINEAPKLTAWTVRDNTSYTSVAELKRAMPFNDPPAVEAGPAVWAAERRVSLAGTVTDDGRPGAVTARWETLEGPGTVTFQDAAAAATTAEFSAPGDYLLRLVADDGELWISDLAAVHILPAGATTLAAWDFNQTHDKEGWSEVNEGTKPMDWPDPMWPTRSEPVKYVAGGYWVLAIEDTPDAYLLSPDALNLNLAAASVLRLRLQNHTPATRMRVRFTTVADPAWEDRKSVEFPVTANDDAPRAYTVDLSAVPGWTGTLKQLRLDLATGTPLTGTCRLDYLAIGGPMAR